MSHVDPSVISRCVNDLLAQFTVASSEDRLRLSHAVHILRPLVAGAEPSPTVTDVRPPHSATGAVWALPIPDSLLSELLKTGADTWLAALFGLHRKAIWYHRARLKIRTPLGRGGSETVRRALHEEWLAHWQPRLSEYGYPKEATA